ncbi:MAG: hypothetical protein KDD73_11835 [Anaerolineales bacterium]|nr:hypothetical protein [Anaerolineales bacterium]MCB9129223.1 hypothetical protein [Ardenticatenales bacterium]
MHHSPYTLLMNAVDILVFVAGLTLVLVTLRSAIYTFILPRSTRDVVTTTLFHLVRKPFAFLAKRASRYERTDEILALYGPVALLLLLPFWLLLLELGFMWMNWAVGVRDWQTAFTLSGSSLLTLGYSPVSSLPLTILSFVEATLGLILIALLIAYLPVIYGAFTRREQELIMLEVRAGSPPSALEMLVRAHRIGRLDALGELWATYEKWFADIEESHTSIAAVAIFRSATPERHWLVASATIMDAAALAASTLEIPRDSRADLCIRAGYMALRRIAAYFDVEALPDPRFPRDPISVTRAEWEAVRAQLGAEGLPLKADGDQAWQDFAGWRVNYDAVLMRLAEIIVVPPRALWGGE